MEQTSKIITVALIAALAIVSGSFVVYASNTMLIATTDVKQPDSKEAAITPIADSNSPSLLLIQHAASGTIVREEDPSTSTIYKLTMNDASPYIVAFSDRPDRIVNSINLTSFIEIWSSGSDSFKADPPNAALVVDTGDGQRTIVVELLNPIFDKTSNSIQYDIVSVGDKSKGGYLGFTTINQSKTIDQENDISGQFTSMTLVIDNLHCTIHPPACI